ncbi:MAG: PAS domain-containing sensor histidine kinase, partial [Melioribacteraceae bacterium]|nr:PAS domain-containing sensor histidine kinase [Melioribacteraceae bacterium]
EQTNAQLTQEIAEKRLAEEALNITEQRLLTMWNSVQSGVLLVRKDNSYIIDSNPSAQRMLGLPQKDIIGNSCHNFIINSDGEECAFSQVNLDKDYHPDCFLVAANGKTIPILKTEIELELNAIKFWLVSFTDVTILKDAEKALVYSKEQAENADKLKSIFLAQMSHEIRTPINVMLSVSSLLQLEVGDKLDEEQLSYFNLINKSGNRITRTVDLLINLSEIQAGTYEPMVKRFDLYSEVLSNLLLEYKKRALEKNINLVINFNAENSYLYGDIYTIEQIFRQLFDNAVIFTETGKISISIFQNNYEKLVVEIQDTGVGISQEYMKKIFSPFTQEEMGYTRKFDGNGIGLSLVKSYCDLNKAKIEVESEKGIGSTFRVIFS